MPVPYNVEITVSPLQALSPYNSTLFAMSHIVCSGGIARRIGSGSHFHLRVVERELPDLRTNVAWARRNLAERVESEIHGHRRAAMVT
jgi:hypothetical protein